MKADAPASIMRCSQELRAWGAAGHGTRTGTVAFASALSAPFDLGLDATFIAALNSRMNAQVRPELAAELAARFIARLRAALRSRLTAALSSLGVCRRTP